MASFSRRFGNGRGTVVEVQAIAVSGITNIDVTSVHMTTTESEPKRTATVFLTIDGDTFIVDLEFMDEAFNSVGITGAKITAPTPL